MASPTYAVLALLPLVSWFLYTQLTRWRFKKFANMPYVKPPSLLLGNLKHMDETMKKIGDPRHHPDYVFRDMSRSMANPELVFVDLRPAFYPMLVIASHDIAEQVSKSSKAFHYGCTKSPTVHALGPLIGTRSILSSEGETWKTLRKQFNPGFAPQHLITLLPPILDKTSIFMTKLDRIAQSGEATAMEPYCNNLTFDVIGKVVTGLDFDAQDDVSHGNDIVRHFRDAMATYTDDDGFWSVANIPKYIKRHILCRQVDASVKRCVTERFEKIKAERISGKKQSSDRSVLALALQNIDALTKDALQDIADQIKTFLVAGHDTTSILLERLFHELSINPKCLATIRAEHDAIFGDSDPRDVFLARPDETMRDLSYTSACIKEALRLWPPAGSARWSTEGNGFKVRKEDGHEIVVDGMVLYLNHFLIQRDPKVYGESADDFVPERWLGNTNTSTTAGDDKSQSGASKIPVSAWRAFERGPRNCIGQEVTNLEARVILACVMRKYDFVKVGAGEVELDEKQQPMVDEKGRYKTKSELFSAISITSKPHDKCIMRIKLR
ncbi:cytochrome P450 [Massariosphaeria phaeospora]|uniref:Cytochrome P450 n=1 Tax=Massariosphaeria phaeospora TaxID=100035 RepID=A0A7C8ICH2_9PLEO|nr:cytochrome P450 [Massariosphaeria phaeospora]